MSLELPSLGEMMMKRWWWRILLALFGLMLCCCSFGLVVVSRLQIERDVEQDTIPIEVPDAGPLSWWLGPDEEM